VSARFRFVPKRAGDCGERRERRRAIRARPTKAKLRRAFETDLRRLVDALGRYDRLRAAVDRERLLHGCLHELEICLHEKPQCSVLRVQKRCCLEALQELSGRPSDPFAVQLRRPLMEPEGLRLALRGRIRPCSQA
jgi:hypothetical protein